MKTLNFFVPGIPQTAGSKRAFAIKKGGQYTGRCAVTDDNPKGKSWKRTVAEHAYAALGDTPKKGVPPPFVGPVGLQLTFWLPRPKYHFRTGKNAHLLRDDAPRTYHAVKPDVLKLARAVEDALSWIVWEDDAQVSIETIQKCYSAHAPGVLVVVNSIDE